MAATVIPRAVRARARADQVAQLYASWQRTTISMLLGAALLAFVLWDHVAPNRPREVDGVNIEVLGLTQRQSEVMMLLAQGKPNKSICRDLRLSEGTVKVHVSAILKALNVHSRSQVIVELARRGIRVERADLRN